MALINNPGSGGSTNFTDGSIPYSSGGILTEDNTNLKWNPVSKNIEANVKFTQSGTGAVPGKVQDELRRWNWAGQFLTAEDGVVDATAGFNAELLTFANYSIPANPTNGGTTALTAGGNLRLGPHNYPISSTVIVPIYSAIQGIYPFNGGQGEAGFFNSRIINNVTGNAAIRLETASIDGIGFFKTAATQDEAVRIVSQFCQVTNCQMDTHKVAIKFSNDVINDAPVYAYIARNTFLHQNDSTTASITQVNTGPGTATAMGGALIEFNNFNVVASTGYLGTSAIAMDGIQPVAVTIRKNIFQNFAASANKIAVDIYSNGGNVEDNDWSMLSSAAGQTALRVGGNTLRVSHNRISNFTIGLRLLSTLTNSVIGPNYFSGNGTDIIIDAGCTGNIIIVPSSATTITDNSGGANLIVRSASGGQNTQGTWTPVLTFGGAAVGMASTKAGIYARQGNVVTVQCEVTLTAKGSSVGTAVISGLPYTVKNQNLSYAAAGAAAYNNMSGIGVGGMMVRGVPNTTTFELITASATDQIGMGDSQFSNTSQFRFTAVYFV